MKMQQTPSKTHWFVLVEEHRDQRATRPDFRVVSAGTDLVEWKELRHIRGTFPTGVQTLYPLKSNSFPLWNWSRQDLSCPNPVCDRSLTAPASHVFWTCPGAQWHWNHLLSLWQCFGTIDMDRRNSWGFGTSRYSEFGLGRRASFSIGSKRHIWIKGYDLSSRERAVAICCYFDASWYIDRASPTNGIS